MMTRRSGLALVALVALAGCKVSNEGEAADTAANAAAQTDVAADERLIRQSAERWVGFVRSKDAAAIAQLYTEDGALMPPNMPIAKGRSAIEQGWASMLNSPGFDLTFEPEEIIVSSMGDMALDRGTYRLGADTGKYVVVWRKVGGEWKAAADIFNSDKPGG